MTYCTKCGKQNPDTAKFCTSCGAVLSPAVAIHVKQTDSIQKSPVISQKKNKTPWIITGIAIILALGTGAYVLFFNKLKKNETNVSSNTTAGNSSGTNPIEKPSDPDAEKLKDLVGQWDVGMNSRNSNQIGNLYNKELVYYRIQMYRDLVVANLGAFFQKNPGYNQHIIGEITVSRPEGGRMECDFTKQVQQEFLRCLNKSS